MITVERVKELVDYDPVTGFMKWAAGRYDKVTGSPAGTVHSSRKGSEGFYVYLDGRTYRTSRVAWFIMTGEWPAGRVYHADGDVYNDEFFNLTLTYCLRDDSDDVFKNDPYSYEIHDGICQADLIRVITYDPKTGHFRWKRGRRGRLKQGNAGCESKSGVKITLNKRRYMAHKLAWLYMYGEWPEAPLGVYHKDGDKLDNRIDNLAVASRSWMCRNTRKLKHEG